MHIQHSVDSGKISSYSLEILTALHSQVERLGLPGEKPLIDIQLANAILVLLNVLIDERKRDLEFLTRR